MKRHLFKLAFFLKNKFPKIYYILLKFARNKFSSFFGTYPYPVKNEIAEVEKVLKSSQWNMTYGRNLNHEYLEAEFSEYIGVPHAIAVGSGGLALQMSMRALGLKPGDEVIHQVDSCSASAQSVMNAGLNPVFSDISKDTLMFDFSDLQGLLNPNTKAIMPTHMWGNCENINEVCELSKKKELFVIEDGCLSLGASYDNKMVGSFGDVGVFSFGCVKPVQGGEGGMIVCSDEGLAKELKSMRHWGDRTIEYGERNVNQLSWNGRMSEIVSAVVREQFKSYPKHLENIRNQVIIFNSYLEKIEGLEISLGPNNNIQESVFTQVVVKINDKIYDKSILFELLKKDGIQLWHANFELITTLNLFKNDIWKEWLYKGDLDFLDSNYKRNYMNANDIFKKAGIGFGKMNFMSIGNLNNLIKSLDVNLSKSIIK